MKPQDYLSEKGKNIFKEIEKHCPNKMPIDSFVISQAAHCLDMLHTSSLAIKDGGAYQEANSGYRQISPEFTVWKESSNRFDKYCAMLGLSEAAREKIQAFSEKKDELPDIGK